MEIYVFTRLRQWWSVTILENLGSDQTIYDSDGWRVAKTNWTERGPDRVAISSDLAESISDNVKNTALKFYNWFASRDRDDGKVAVFAWAWRPFSPKRMKSGASLCQMRRANERERTGFDSVGDLRRQKEIVYSFTKTPCRRDSSCHLPTPIAR